MGKKLKPKSDEKVLADEMAAFDMRVKGMPQWEIAKKLNMTQQAVSLILKRVTSRYAKEFLEDVAHTKNEHVIQLEEVASQAMEAWHKSKNTHEIKKQKKTSHGGDDRSIEMKDQYGDPRFLHEFRKAKEDIRKILGVDLVEQELFESDLVGRIQIEVIGCETEDMDVTYIANTENSEH